MHNVKCFSTRSGAHKPLRLGSTKKIEGQFKWGLNYFWLHCFLYSEQAWHLLCTENVMIWRDKVLISIFWPEKNINSYWGVIPNLLGPSFHLAYFRANAFLSKVDNKRMINFFYPKHKSGFECQLTPPWIGLAISEDAK